MFSSVLKTCKNQPYIYLNLSEIVINPDNLEVIKSLFLANKIDLSITYDSNKQLYENIFANNPRNIAKIQKITFLVKKEQNKKNSINGILKINWTDLEEISVKPFHSIYPPSAEISEQN